MDCCNYPEYRAAPYYYYPSQYPPGPYWPGPLGYGGGGGGGHAGHGAHGGHAGLGPQYPPPPPSPAYPLHVQPARDLDYGLAHHMPTDYGYGGKERLRRMRERVDAHRGALEWAEGSYLPSVNESLRDTPWTYYQNGCNSWQPSSNRGGYPVRPLALPPPPPALAYPHPTRDPLRGMAAMQAATITPDKMPSSCSWEHFHREAADDRSTPRPRAAPPSVSPAPRQYRPRARDDSKAGSADRARKNKSPKSAAREEAPEPAPAPAPALPPAQPAQPAVPLPAFQQAFGSTEIGRFSEAFTSAGAITEDMVSRAISQGLLGEWDTKEGDEPWPARQQVQIKCEDTY